MSNNRFIVYNPKLARVGIPREKDEPIRAEPPPERFVTDQFRKKNRDSINLWKKALAYTRTKR